MVDYSTLVKFVYSIGGNDLPLEICGLSLALFLRENPNKPYWKGNTLFIFDTINNSYLYCNPFNKKQKWWYRANGLNNDYYHYYWNLSNARLRS